MSDFITKLSDMIDPEVMGDMVSARIPKKLRVAPLLKLTIRWRACPAIPSPCPPTPASATLPTWPRAARVAIEKMTTSTPQGYHQRRP